MVILTEYQRVPLVNLTFVILASQIGICEKRAYAKAVLSMLRSFLSWQLSGTSVLGTGDSWVIKRGLVPIAWKAADPRAF